MASVLSNYGKGEILKGNIDLENDTIKIAFMDPSHVVDIDGDHFYSDISADIAPGSADQTLANVSVTVDDTNDYAVVDADNVSVSNETISGGTDAVYIFKDTGNVATSPLIAFIELGAVYTPIDGTLAVNWNASGIFAV